MGRLIVVLSVVLALSGCSGSSSSDADDAGTGLEGTWNAACAPYTLAASPEGESSLETTTVYAKAKMFFTAMNYTSTINVYSDALCTTQTTVALSSGAYALGGGSPNVDGAVEIDLDDYNAAILYSIIKYDATTMYIGKFDATHDGSVATKRPVDLEEFEFIKEATATSETPSVADCSSTQGSATVTYTAAGSTYPGVEDSQLVCGYIWQPLSNTTSVDFDIAKSLRDTTQGRHAPLDIGWSGWPPEAGKTYSCDITFSDDDDVEILIKDDTGTCSVTISSYTSQTSFSGSFTATKLIPLFGSSKMDSVSGTFTVQ
jgi:hypothetical protein